ncbi:MFS transporter [Herbiconiux daphne]|uniref:MFS transporter n=1 Tax=Herbiconiux daphne TaxID=2970914 RepID=A0ABT2H516_9MICO|nr:MFS transporter [Herbiconiux daphne]MCS5735029.1 MFS transporter [Herbiconiux daphne]
MTSSSYPVVSVLRAPHTGYLLFTSLVGRLPGAMAALAIVQLVRSTSGDFGFAGLVTAVYVVAGAVGQPLLGRLIDRFGQVAILTVSGILSFLAFTGMALTLEPVPALAVALAAAAGVFTPPLEPALRALWPRLVSPGPHLKAAFSLDAGAQEIIFIIGPLLTVAGIAVFGPVGNLLFAGGLGLVGALAFVVNPAPRAASVRRHPDAAARPRVGTPILIPAVARIAVCTFGIGVPVGALTIVATASEVARNSDGLAGWILAVNALGALIGATVVGIRPLGSTPARLLTACGALLAVGYLPLAATALPTWAYVVAAGISGLMLPPTLGQVFERIAQLSPAAALTEANGWVVSAMTLGVGAGTLVAGAIVGAAGTPVVTWIVVGASAVTAGLALAALPGRAEVGEARSDPAARAETGSV